MAPIFIQVITLLPTPHCCGIILDSVSPSTFHLTQCAFLRRWMAPRSHVAPSFFWWYQVCLLAAFIVTS